MPIFEYQCRDCGRGFEAFVTGERIPACPGCQSANLARLLSRLGLVGVGDAPRPEPRSRLAAAAPAAPPAPVG